MNKILEVVKPFFIMEVGDTFELSEDETEYISEFNMERHEDDEDSSVISSYNSKYSISKEYAQQLIADGYLSEHTTEPKFINIFDEIERLRKGYSEELASAEHDGDNQHVVLERKTVLTNLITLLNYLSSLKKQ